MSNPAKSVSDKDGKRFLQQAFHEQQKVLQAQLEYAKKTITHDGKCGDVTEKHFLKLLAAYLPNRYAVDSAIVIDSKGQTSDQMDVVIYDCQYTPCLLDQHDHKYIPAEAVYAVLEVKPEINAKYLTYAGKKARSVRRLHRTSIPIPHAGGTPYPPKALFPITAGLIAAEVAWKDGFGKTFAKQFNALKGDHRLDCVLAVSSASFDAFEKKPLVVGGNNALVFFLFRLLQKLQSLGTVPAIDWNAYASQLANVKLP
ncbi:MAG TPA: DUF6602 domain-containing protein [Verrucomicrobiae bacterium]|nr:DUF6602 domain-containing protein [Verrucomicrobiae bacterium]